MRPLIGITGRRLSYGLMANGDPRYADTLVDQFFSDFAHGVHEAGGIPVHLPFESDSPDVVARLDGLIITGGQDIHPRYWGGDEQVVQAGADPRQLPSVHDPERDRYELRLARAAISAGVPLLGVCRGHQVLNVALGGTLVPDLAPGEVQHYLALSAPSDGTEDHLVRFDPGSLAASLYGESATTNAWHHQAVATCGSGLVPTGRTSDGVVEAVELPGRPVLGVQWHPEWQITPDPAFAWLVGAAGLPRVPSSDAPMSELPPIDRQDSSA